MREDPCLFFLIADSPSLRNCIMLTEVNHKAIYTQKIWPKTTFLVQYTESTTTIKTDSESVSGDPPFRTCSESSLFPQWDISLRLKGSGYFYNIYTARVVLHVMVYLLPVCLCVQHDLFIYFFLPWADTLTFMQLRQERRLQGHAQISRAMSREYKMCSRALTCMCVFVLRNKWSFHTKTQTITSVNFNGNNFFIITVNQLKSVHQK